VLASKVVKVLYNLSHGPLVTVLLINTLDQQTSSWFSIIFYCLWFYFYFSTEICLFVEICLCCKQSLYSFTPHLDLSEHNLFHVLWAKCRGLMVKAFDSWSECCWFKTWTRQMWRYISFSGCWIHLCIADNSPPGTGWCKEGYPAVNEPSRDDNKSILCSAWTFCLAYNRL